jgi:hypothetical protein
MFEELMINAITAERDRKAAQFQLSREALRLKRSARRGQSGTPVVAWPRPLAWLRFSRS